ncbi:DUF2510 domain-containing protein [Streptomyces sp. MMS24-I2-30]|uniref:DUF2510 domain-containing protein n=1 Tax=Streptomyces sp. MMS24-I2-30 TaxID=3351564 RepID=UPI0038969756
MTQVTPPGWYPDPGQTHEGPPTERWWDGKAWTDQTRPAGSAAWGPPTQTQPAGPYPPQQPGEPNGSPQPGEAYGSPQPGGPYGPYPPYPAQPPAAPRRGLRTGIAVGVAAAVLACIGVGVYALSDSGSGGGDQAGSQRGPGFQGGQGGQGGSEGQNGGQGGQGGPFGGPGGGSGGSGEQSPAPDQSGAPEVKGGGTVSDALNGISMPVPDGWTGQAFSAGAQLASDHSYNCPGDTSQKCTDGGAYSAPAVALGTKGSTAEEVAKADIQANAEESYGGKTYGSITSHEVLASKAVTVAGQQGYLVRWKAVTSKGSDGYVESLAFPSPANAQQMVVVRFGVDVGQKVTVIDEITQGIKVSSGGGDGQNV